MEKNISNQLTALNQAYKEFDDVYHIYAREHNLSDTALWVLYSVWERGESYTQRELCTDWFYSPQTVNSALKLLERQGLIRLVQTPEDRRNKHILFTPKGKVLGEAIIAPLIEAERKAFSGLSERERTELLSTTQRHITLLRQEAGKISNVSSEDCSPQ